jgi:hypothetical protein
MVSGKFLHWSIFGSALFFLSGSSSIAAFQEDLRTQFFQYATETNATLNLNSTTTIKTDHFISKFIGYVETGKRGTWNIDADPLRYDFHYDEEKNNFIWLGREHPLNLTRNDPVQVTDAIGNIWAQNQINALNPRVVGWFSTGILQHLNPNLVVVGAFSPLFIPTFGPSLGFNDSGDLQPVRYARLPPASVNTGGVLLPIRYQLELGQIKDLLLRNQYFAGIVYKNENVYLEATYFSAPRPNAVPITQSALQITPQVVYAKVQIDPQFPREHWSTYRAQLLNVPLQPAVEFVYGIKSGQQQNHDQYLSLSGNLSTGFRQKASFGLLTSFQKNPEDPEFSDLLAFAYLPFHITDSWSLNTLVRSTLLNTRQSIYSMLELQYDLNQNLSLLSSIRVLSGKNYSYFGDWRSEDSFTLGMRVLL